LWSWFGCKRGFGWWSGFGGFGFQFCGFGFDGFVGGAEIFDLAVNFETGLEKSRREVEVLESRGGLGAGGVEAVDEEFLNLVFDDLEGVLVEMERIGGGDRGGGGHGGSSGIHGKILSGARGFFEPRPIEPARRDEGRNIFSITIKFTIVIFMGIVYPQFLSLNIPLGPLKSP